ncbi:hypothetical protein [Polynucleobacter ibericus]|uniref:hypothetical protein n=1 Tax=Polynucleobacter ibericus TaxID=1819725 RepID=UPI001BFD0B86|nr:hypothetical protein [Polynucleobacter ibericus]QWE08417.1 hypothetical protein AOC20_08345 [Polynucleobacter ibericus]
MHYFMENHVNVVRYAPYIFLVSILIFFSIGWIFGKYRLRISDKVIVQDYLASAIFGLSALVLGFTFSGANDHFDQRVSLMRAQADAITQIYQSSKYLAPKDQIAVRNSLKEIIADRLSIYQGIRTFVALNENVANLGSKLNEFNELMMVSIPRAPSNNRDLADKILRPQVDRLMEVMRDGMLNSRHHPPAILERFLFTLLTIGALLSGYAMAIKKEEDWFLTIIYLALMGFALYVIFALEFPNELFPYEAFNADLLRTQTLLQ